MTVNERKEIENIIRRLEIKLNMPGASKFERILRQTQINNYRRMLNES